MKQGRTRDGRPLSAVGRDELLAIVEELAHENGELRLFLAYLVKKSVGEAGSIVVPADPPEARLLPEFRIDPEPPRGVRLWFGKKMPGDP